MSGHEKNEKSESRQSTTQELTEEGRKVLGSFLGAFLYAAGINLFAVPAGLYTGGVMGICQVIRTLLMEYLHLDFGQVDIAGIIYYVVNIPIFLLAYKRLGRKFFFKTLATVTASTFFLSLIPAAALVQDTMAACVVGGIVSGAGVGIILRMGSSGGGMDVIGVLLIKRKRDFSVGRLGLLVNLVLYGACFFLFDVGIVVYSVIFAAVYSVAMDRVHIQNINVEVNIITKADTAQLEREVFEELGRGITKWDALGAYTHEKSHVLYVMLSKYEVNRLRAIVHKYDEQAFIVVNEGVSVDGNYLKKL
ncbi:MAG TPA: YitT family protein [Candidatus Acetatifactor stercoripullorum]|uniref:YitT family protein n=1 Tax=Candidatus Acetatifactor stercoripullorum TaxID=2838414 RepID=A0A9D1R5L1_9FIRM|nr:YitT family protein [uncultured Acetatifactor sp.]HIW80933.1 YitT family protein [Candidatus Acetatifactor stercoripullorum]